MDAALGELLSELGASNGERNFLTARAKAGHQAAETPASGSSSAAAKRAAESGKAV
jgi:hypothetical protein